MTVTRTPLGDPAHAPAVSVVVLRHYPDASWTAKYRASVADQTGLAAWEMVEVDNFRNEHTIGAGLTLGAREARAALVFFLGDDDWLDERALSILKRLLDRDSAAVVARCSAHTVDASGRPVSDTVNPGPPGLWRRSAFLDLGGFPDKSLREDEELHELREAAGMRSVRIPRALYFYRLHQDQASRSYKKAAGVYDTLRQRGHDLGGGA